MRLLLTGAALLLLALPAAADTLTFGFDDVGAPGPFKFIVPGFDNGPTLTYATATFEGGVILSDVLFANAATSGPNILASCDTCTLGDGSGLPGVIRASFTWPVESVGLDVINGVGSPGTYTLTAFDADGDPIGSDSVVLAPMGAAGFVQPLAVSGGDIASVTVTTTLNGYTFAIDTVVAELTVGTWSDAGGSVAGTNGTPVLEGQGPLLSGTQVTLTLANALPGGSAILVLGFSTLGAPFKQGILVPSPDVLIPGLPLDGTGGLVLSFPWPAGLPAGVMTWYQYWIPDAGGPAGFAASNGVEAATP